MLRNLAIYTIIIIIINNNNITTTNNPKTQIGLSSQHRARLIHKL